MINCWATLVLMPRNVSSKKDRNEESQRLKKLRESLGFTVRELATEFKVNAGSITHWENGTHSIPGSVLKLIEIYEAKAPSKKK